MLLLPTPAYQLENNKIAWLSNALQWHGSNRADSTCLYMQLTTQAVLVFGRWLQYR